MTRGCQRDCGSRTRLRTQFNKILRIRSVGRLILVIKAAGESGDFSQILSKRIIGDLVEHNSSKISDVNDDFCYLSCLVYDI